MCFLGATQTHHTSTSPPPIHFLVRHHFYQKLNPTLFEKLKNGIKISVGHTILGFIGQNVQNIVLINNSTVAWPTKILMPYLSSRQFASGAYITFSKKCYWLKIFRHFTNSCKDYVRLNNFIVQFTFGWYPKYIAILRYTKWNVLNMKCGMLGSTTWVTSYEMQNSFQKFH